MQGSHFEVLLYLNSCRRYGEWKQWYTSCHLQCAFQSTETELDNERPFYIDSVTQVNTKKFRTKAMNYRVQFTNALAHVEITSLHEQLHEIFQQILDETIGGIPPQDQLRFVLHSKQLDKPIHFPFMTAERLTTERILAEFEHVIQSNQEFRLNDTMEINVIHVSMPIGGRGNKRSEVN